MQSIRNRLSRSFVRRVGRKSPMNKRRTALCTWQARTGISSALRALHVDGKCRSNVTMSYWSAHSPCVVVARSTAPRVGSPSRMKSCYVVRLFCSLALTEPRPGSVSYRVLPMHDMPKHHRLDDIFDCRRADPLLSLPAAFNDAAHGERANVYGHDARSCLACFARIQQHVSVNVEASAWQRAHICARARAGLFAHSHPHPHCHTGTSNSANIFTSIGASVSTSGCSYDGICTRFGVYDAHGPFRWRRLTTRVERLTHPGTLIRCDPVRNLASVLCVSDGPFNTVRGRKPAASHDTSTHSIEHGQRSLVTYTFCDRVRDPALVVDVRQ